MCANSRVYYYTTSWSAASNYKISKSTGTKIVPVDFGFYLTPSGPITWNHLQSRCAGTQAVAARISAVELAPGIVEVAPLIEEHEILDYIPIQIVSEEDEPVDIVVVEPAEPEVELDSFVPEEALPMPAPTPIEIVPIAPLVSQPEILPVQVLPELILPDEVLPEISLPEEILPEEVLPEEVMPEEAPSEEIPQEEIPVMETVSTSETSSTMPPGGLDRNALLACVVVCCLCRRW